MGIFEHFPYTNFHNLNTDWLVKVAKEVLEKYDTYKSTIEEATTDITELAETLEAQLNAWYDTHSEDIATALADSLTAISTALNSATSAIATDRTSAETAIASARANALTDIQTTLTNAEDDFEDHADEYGAQVIASLPPEYLNSLYGVHMVYPQHTKGITGVMAHVANIMVGKRYVAPPNPSIVDDATSNIIVFETGKGFITGDAGTQQGIARINRTSGDFVSYHTGVLSLSGIESTNYAIVNESDFDFLDLDFMTDGMPEYAYRKYEDVHVTNFSTASSISAQPSSYGGTNKAFTPFRMTGTLNVTGAVFAGIYNAETGAYNRTVTTFPVTITDEVVVVFSTTPDDVVIQVNDEGGGGGAEGAVLYSESQNLTTLEKTQAKVNIGANFDNDINTLQTTALNLGDRMDDVEAETGDLKNAIEQTDSGLDAYGIRLNYYTDSGKQTGYRVRTDNGELSGQTGMDASGYISVKANSEYDLNYSYYSSASYGMAFYDSSKTFISGIKQSASTSSSETVHFKFTTPANCAYIRISIFQSYTTPIVLLNVTNADIVRENEKSIGLIEDALNNAGVRYNYYRGGRTAENRVKTDNGELAYQYDHDASELVKVDAQTKYELSFSYYSSGNYGIAFYDNSKTFISGAKQSNTSTSSATTPFTFTTPANCAYLRFTIPQSLTNPITLFDVTNSDVKSAVKKANSAIDNGTFTFEQIGITVSAGIRTELSPTLNTDSASYVHAEITVTDGEIYTVRGVSYRYGFPCWILLDADGNVLSFSSYAGQTTDLVKTERVYITEKAHTLWVNNNSTLTNISVKKAAPAVIDSGLRGKKIVWFGTSIPAGNTGSGGANKKAYPDMLGDMLGATVYNESIGSSRVRGGSYHNISADDPMGWAGMSAIGVMLSLSLSSSEKQTIADDWDTKWKNIIGNPTTVNMDNIDTYKASSWDSILPKYLTGGSVGQCDAYVFDHGYNEGVTSYGFSDLSDVPETTDDRTYWMGAMDFVIRKIVADNPKAKIIIIGHYNNTGSQSYNNQNWYCSLVCDAQNKLANRWGANIIKTWELLNLSTQTITVDNEQKTVIEARYPDGIHPASDTTGAELQRYADALLPYFNMIALS